jgi:hypothetical protein
VNVIMTALPMPPRNVTELVPLPEHPAQVKVPEVEKVTGSALAADTPSDAIKRSGAHLRMIARTPVMLAPLLFPLEASGALNRRPRSPHSPW